MIHPPGEQERTCSEDRSNFVIVWHDLTYKVNCTNWLKRTKERLFGSSSDISEQIYDDINTEKISQSSKQKIILDHVCGDAKSRQLTAIMGPSGSGKSSLLNCLFQNYTKGVTGQILVDGPRHENKLRICFIPQNDYLNEWLTVREDLVFVSKLKSARDRRLFNGENNIYVRQDDSGCRSSTMDHEANALSVAELLCLTGCLDVIIKNISGGQKKLLSIARELMSKPDILVLDEPTTGLDSLTCYKTVQVLRDLARLSVNPIAIIVTIHQPEQAVFNLFDKAYFISRKGRIIYDGSPKNAVQVIEDVAKMKPPSNYNLASFLIEIASDKSQFSAIHNLSVHQQNEFSNKYSPSYLKALVQSRTDQERTTNRNYSSMNLSTALSIQETISEVEARFRTIKSSSPELPKNSSESYFIHPQLTDCLSDNKSSNLSRFFEHTSILTHRSWLTVARNSSFIRARLVFHTLLPLLMFLIYGRYSGALNNCPKIDKTLSLQDMNKNIQNGLIRANVESIRISAENISFFFVNMYGFGINLLSFAVPHYSIAMFMFRKEHMNGLYSSGPYFIGHTLAELPLEMLYPALSIILSYQLTGQLSSFMEWRMFSVVISINLVCYSIYSMGMFFGSVFVNYVNIANLISHGLLLPYTLLCGLIIPPKRMKNLMHVLSYASPFKHGIAAFVAARYGFNTCDCDEELIPYEGETMGFGRIDPNTRHVIEYLFPHNSSVNGQQTSNSENVDVVELFSKMGERFVKAQSFALDIKSCEDVKPYLMHVLNIYDSDLFISIACLLINILVFKVMTYCMLVSFSKK